MPINTVFDPKNLNEFEKAKINKYGKGISATITAGTNQNIDFVLSDDFLMTGGSCIVIGAEKGDYVDFQVIHPVYGVVNQFITEWYINPNQSQQEIPRSFYPAKLFAGLTLRVIYHSIGVANVWIAVNYDMEKILV
jgi:hypothetical protein